MLGNPKTARALSQVEHEPHKETSNPEPDSSKTKGLTGCREVRTDLQEVNPKQLKVQWWSRGLSQGSVAVVRGFVQKMWQPCAAAEVQFL